MIKQAQLSDLASVEQLAKLLWPSQEFTDLKEELSQLLSQENVAFFLAFEDSQAVAFAQCQLRQDYVEGTVTSPVGYLEGIYVAKEYRRKGIASQLFQSCEQWAIDQSCSEFASDCEITNYESFAFHLSLGFQEVNRLICFNKTIG